tara:strand:- start:73 stop:540 length:468 start_codon:yes stop_codon:yes gene_type:complete
MFNLSKIFVTLFYIGYSNIIPGTIGSFFAFIIILFAHTLLDLIYFYILFAICFVLSLYLIKIYQETINKNDPSEIVVDEFLGVFTIFLFFDNFDKLNFYTICIIGFILFRMFDVLKPFPINWIDKKIKNSFGVIFDDIVSGIYSVICLIIINELI